jgi:predicted nucleic-acid-binding Zn-ribbon protein
MNDTKDTGGSCGELAELVDASFPNLKCLRCGYEKFFLASDVHALAAKGGQNKLSVLALQSMLADPVHAQSPVVTLACQRCGHIEQHLTGMLTKAAKPIPNGER